MTWIVATFYKFVSLTELPALREQLLAQCQDWGVRGTILLAEEGINATVAGDRVGIDQLLAYLQAHPALGQSTTKSPAPSSHPSPG